MGGKGALHYLPIVHKASIYVPKVMRKQVIGGDTVSETFMHMFSLPMCMKFQEVAQTDKSERDG